MFRSFEGTSADHVWHQAAMAFQVGDDVLVQSSRGGSTKEILRVAITISDPRQRWVVSRLPPLSVAFALAEFIWIVTGRNDLAFLKTWNRRLPQYVGSAPQVHGAYGYRLRRSFCIDQLTRAYQALKYNPDTRQIVLQLWDSSVDLPKSDGTPASQDIPCNVVSLLKIRSGKLEWLQIVRSNDLFRGVPYDFVQFTCLQEIMAGWLGIDCGAYHQISDSLHVYDRDEEHILSSEKRHDLPSSTDSLALPKEQSEAAFGELGRRVEQMIAPDIAHKQLIQVSIWDEGPEAFRNILAVLASEAARRHGWLDIIDDMMATCSNPVYKELWRRWLSSTNPE